MLQERKEPLLFLPEARTDDAKQLARRPRRWSILALAAAGLAAVGVLFCLNVYFPVQNVLFMELGSFKHSDAPLVSVMVLTVQQRSGYLQFALEQISAQTYPNIEVVVVDDSPVPPNTSAVPALAWRTVRLVHLPTRASIGTKRNAAVAAARGVVVVTWDDDDFYSPARVANAVEPILRGEANLTVLPLKRFAWVGAVSGLQFFESARSTHVHGGTLAFARRAWGEGVGNHYQDVSIAEDVGFAEEAVGRCLCTKVLPPDGVYTRHVAGGNTWGWNGVGVAFSGERLASTPPPPYVSPAHEKAIIAAEIAFQHKPRPPEPLHLWLPTVRGRPLFQAGYFFPNMPPSCYETITCPLNDGSLHSYYNAYAYAYSSAPAAAGDDAPAVQRPERT